MSRANRRYYRTLVLGVAAMASLVWVAIAQFDIPLQEVASLLLGIVLATLIVIALAALVALLWVGLRKLWRGKGPD